MNQYGQKKITFKRMFIYFSDNIYVNSEKYVNWNVILPSFFLSK
jgi:hypothetical protein